MAWFKSHPVIRVGLSTNEPFTQIDPRTGTVVGYIPPFLVQLQKQMGVRLQPIWYASSTELDEAFRLRQIDIVVPKVQTPEALKNAIFSDPFLRLSNKLLVRNDYRGEAVLEELYDVRLSVVANSPVAGFLNRNYPILPQQAYLSESEAALAVVQGKADMVVLDQAKSTWLIRQTAYARLRIIGESGYNSLFRIAVRSDWPLLAHILDKAIASVPDNEMRALYNRWMLPPQPQLLDSRWFWGAVSAALLMLAIWMGWLTHVNRRLRKQTQDQLIQLEHELWERQQMTSQLSQTQFTVDHSTVGVFQVNWDGRIQYANQAAAKLIEYTSLELVRLRLQQVMPQFTVDSWLDFWHDLRSRQSATFEGVLEKRNGGRVAVEVTASYLAWAESEYIVCFMTDITERLRIEKALRQSEARFKGIASNVPGVVFQLERSLISEEVNLTYLSDGSSLLLGYAPAEILNKDLEFSLLIHDEDRTSFERSWRMARDRLADWHWQGRIIRRDQTVFWVDLKAEIRRLESGTVVWDGILWDITNNKQNELSLLATGERLRELSVHLESVREEEKAKIAREVHDELGQVLTALKLETSLCELSFAANHPALQERLTGMKKLIDQTIKMVRDVASALRPPVLDLGLAAALDWYARRFEARFGLPVAVTIADDVPFLDEMESTALFRVVQEALTNVARHADAGSVRIDLVMRDEVLILTIADDGKGFDIHQSKEERSFGLIGIRERIEMIGGEFTIDSRLYHGTVLLIQVPMKEKVRTS